MQSRVSFPSDFHERVYAGWLGKCIGVRLGAPVEGWTYDFIRSNLGEVRDFMPLPPGKFFKPDDDTAFPMLLVRAIEDYGPNVTSKQLGETWLNYLGDQHGTLWWGGYGISSEHTAYLNLRSGIPAPISGSAALNGLAISEQIGGQIFSDIWGLMIPNNPIRAADYAERASRVSHDGNGVFGGRFIAAMVSQAFSESNPCKLIETGLSVIPPDSEYARVVIAMLKFYSEESNDWHAAYQYLAQNFGYDKYAGVVPIISNAGVVVLALLYGQGDFARSVQIAVNAGWDTDCNAGNVGAILGVALGLENIPEHWRSSINDTLIIASLIGANNLTTISECTDMLVRAAYRLENIDLPTFPRYHFTYPGSTQGFEHRSSDRRGEVISIHNVTLAEGKRYLRATFRKLNKKGESLLYVRTYLQTSSLSSNFYGASFSPKIYPGQTIRARVGLPQDENTPLTVSLYVWDLNHQKRYQGLLETLNPGEFKILEYRIPPLENACISEVGFVIHNLEDEVWNGSILIDYLDFTGQPCFKDNFRFSKTEGGAISQWTYLRGNWRKEADGYHGSGYDVSASYTGDLRWTDYRLRVWLKPLFGSYHNIMIRVQGALRSYALGLAPGNQICLYKTGPWGYQTLVSTPFDWQLGETYELWLKGNGDLLRGGVGNKTFFEFKDTNRPYLNGMMGFSNFAGCHTCYEGYEIE